MQRTLIPDAIGDDRWYVTVYYEEGWRRVITWLFGPDSVTYPLAPLHTRQRFFLGPAVADDPAVPEGVACLEIDASLLGQTGLIGVQELTGFASGDFCSPEAFVPHGFGLCLVRDQELLGWCTTDCVVGARAELGIAIRPAHRRRGYASLLARKMIAECGRRGIGQVGWHCFEQNIGSAATAVGAGLTERQPHHLAQYWLNPIDSHLVHGNQHLFAGNYARARARYLLALEGALVRSRLALSQLFADPSAREFYRDLAELCRRLTDEEAQRPSLQAELEMLIAGTSLRQAGY